MIRPPSLLLLCASCELGNTHRSTAAAVVRMLARLRLCLKGNCATLCSRMDGGGRLGPTLTGSANIQRIATCRVFMQYRTKGTRLRINVMIESVTQEKVCFLPDTL